MNNRGFSLVTVLVLSLIIFIIGGTGAYVVMTNMKTTQADVKYNLADKASNAGLLSAFDYINRTGSGGSDRTEMGTIGNVNYSYRIMFGGKNIWFVSSEGSYANSKVVRTSIFQGYYGVGLYTVRGRVNATLGNARLSGCDRENNCLVPAFIASGNISTSVTPRYCNSDNGGTGVYGQEPVLNLSQGDLSRIFFKVKCFNKYGDNSCNQSLLDYLEYDYGRDPDAIPTPPHKFINFQQNSNKYGIPLISLPAIPTPPNLPSSCEFNTTGGINLSNQYLSCNEIRLRRSPTYISGNGRRGDSKIKIYAQNYNTIFNGAENFILYTNANSTFNDNTNNFEVYTNANTTLNSASNFKIYSSGLTTLENINYARIVSTNNVTVNAGATINNSRIIIGVTDINETNNVNTQKNLIFNGNVTIGNSTEDNNPNVIIARSLRFANGSSVRILNSLIYVYAYACPNCPRNTDTSSLNACDSNNFWCGWYGSGISLNLGRDSSGNPNPILFISNNTTVRTDSPSGTVYIWGVWYGEDITYLRWQNASSQDLRGFLIRNFPEDRSLNINITSGFNLIFSKSIIDKVSSRFRFFRDVECVRDPLTPQAQMIQTRMVNY